MRPLVTVFDSDFNYTYCYYGKCRSFYDYFGVFGPVSRVTFIADKYKTSVDFNHLGEPECMTILYPQGDKYSQPIKIENGIWTAMLKRGRFDVIDAFGRVVKEYDGDPAHPIGDEQERIYTYDSQSRITMVSGTLLCYRDYPELNYIDRIYYDNYGRIKEIQHVQQDKILFDKLFEFFEIDQYNNWLSAIERNKEGNPNNYLMRREIEYF